MDNEFDIYEDEYLKLCEDFSGIKNKDDTLGIGLGEYLLTPNGWFKASVLADFGEAVTLYTGKRWARFKLDSIESKSYVYVKMTSGMKMHVGCAQCFVDASGVVLRAKYLQSGDTPTQVFKRPEKKYNYEALQNEGPKGKILAFHYDNLRTIELECGEVVPVLRTGLTIPMVAGVIMINEPIDLCKIVREDGEMDTVLVNGFLLVTGEK